MAVSLSAGDRAEIETLITEMERAWNAGDGAGFAARMAPDADFVNIRAELFRGREAIAAGHVGILRSIYAGSSNRLTIESIRLLRPDVAVAHVRAKLDVPAGPMAGHHSALFSMVLTREEGGWQIASFHNTLAPPPGRA